MKIYEFDYDGFPKIDEQIVLCLGYFDGVHLGHQKIIEEAKAFGKKVGVLSFSNSTYNFMNNTEEFLTPTDKKIEIFDSLGVDYYFEIIMSKRLLNASKGDFLEKIARLNPEICVCGKDYTFGHNKEGKVKDLIKVFKTKVVDFEKWEDEKISSTAIFRALELGDTYRVTKLLGRPYYVSGRVVEGEQNGQRLGFPTANVMLNEPYYMPRQGVYFGYAVLYDEKYPAMATYGTHPTFEGLEQPILEVHILNFKDDIYGDILGFEFIQFVRENEKFEDIYELMERIRRDKFLAIDFFETKKD